MNKRILIKTAGLLLSGLALAGCVSKTAPNWTVKEQPEPEIRAALRAPEPKVEAVLQEAAAKPAAPFEGAGWQSLFDGQDLKGWSVTDFSGHGAVTNEAGLIVIEAGAALSGVNWTNDLPKMNYEVALDAMKLDGTDFFCGLTFPVGDEHCSLILGGWGGALVGLSSIDDHDASENETTDFVKFETGKWYRVRVRVTDKKIEAWLDDKQEVNLPTTGRTIGLRFGEIELSKPLGVATYQTRAAVREVRVRRLGAGEKN